MILYESTIRQFHRDLIGKKLAHFLSAEYTSYTEKQVSPEMFNVWKYTLQLVGAELTGEEVDPDCGIRIDLEESAHLSHMSLIFASHADDRFRYAVIGLYGGAQVRMTRADDIVCFREEGVEWTTIHPSMQMGTCTRRIFRGIPEDEIEKIRFESASFLYDCMYSGDCDIVSGYKREVTAESSVFYANDLADLSAFLKDTLVHGGGSRALVKLRSIENLSASMNRVDMTEDQLYLVSSITNNVLRGRKAWYIIEGQAGSGKSEIVRRVCGRLEQDGKTVERLQRGEAPKGTPDLIILSQKQGAQPDQLALANVGIYMYDEMLSDVAGFEMEEKLHGMAQKADAQLYISHLKQSMAFADGGKGYRFLVSLLQLAHLQREDFDPSMYMVTIADAASPGEERIKPGIARIVLGEGIDFDPSTEKIRMSSEDREQIYRSLSHGKIGAQIFCQDPALRQYLKKKIEEHNQRQVWIRDFSGQLLSDEPKEESQCLEDVEAICGEYGQTAKNALGEPVWNMLAKQSRVWIISALMAYDNFRKYSHMMDFSGVCVQIGKCCELELKIRFFTKYIEYLKDKYKDRLLEKAPESCMNKPDDHHPKAILPDEKIMLGNLRFIMGLGFDGKVKDEYAWNEFSSYAKDVLLVNSSDPLRTMADMIPIIMKIKDDYRNRSAHSDEISAVDARECIEYVITVNRKLGVMLSQFKF